VIKKNLFSLASILTISAVLAMAVLWSAAGLQGQKKPTASRVTDNANASRTVEDTMWKCTTPPHGYYPDGEDFGFGFDAGEGLSRFKRKMPTPIAGQRRGKRIGGSNLEIKLVGHWGQVKGPDKLMETR
jgi:hypothetical protein